MTTPVTDLYNSNLKEWVNEWSDSRRKYSANKSQMVRKTDDTEDNKTTEKQRKYATSTLKKQCFT